MGESVKLTDGKYIDTEGVYDATKGETQSEINSRLGTVVYVSPASGSKTLAKGESYTICSLVLPNYGKWLVCGSFSVSGLSNLLVIDDSSNKEWANFCVPGKASSDTIHAWTVLSGGRTAILSISPINSSLTYSWGADWRYFGLKAVCIG